MAAVSVWRVALAAFLAGVVVVGFVVMARAQAPSQCGPHKRLVQVLADKYGEAPKAIGGIDRQRFMEAYVSNAGSWTILVTTTSGYSCIVASGNDWEDVPFRPGARS